MEKAEKILRNIAAINGKFFPQTVEWNEVTVFVFRWITCYLLLCDMPAQKNCLDKDMTDAAEKWFKGHSK